MNICTLLYYVLLRQKKYIYKKKLTFHLETGISVEPYHTTSLSTHEGSQLSVNIMQDTSFSGNIQQIATTTISDDDD